MRLIEVKSNNNSSEYKQASFAFEYKTPIAGFSIINKKFLVFCQDSIHVIETGNEKDPNNDFPHAPNTTQLILNKGISNNIIKNIFEYLTCINDHRYKDLQAISFNKNIDMESIKSILWELLLNLSSLEDSYLDFRDNFNNQLKNLEIPKTENNFTLNAFIPNIEKKVKDIIVTEASGVFNKLTRLLIVVYNKQLSNNKKSKILDHDKRLGVVINELINAKCITEASDFSQFIKDSCINFLDEFIDLRNTLEHPSEKKFVSISNFRLLPDRKYCAPEITITKNEDVATSYLMDLLEAYMVDIYQFCMDFITLIIYETIDSFYMLENNNIVQKFRERKC